LGQAPGGVFNRGFVRASLVSWAFDEEKLLAEYDLAAATSARIRFAGTRIRKHRNGFWWDSCSERWSHRSAGGGRCVRLATIPGIAMANPRRP